MAAIAKLCIYKYDRVSEDPSLWLWDVVHTRQANQWTGAIRLRQAKASLVGAAELWFESQGGNPKHNTWVEFPDVLVTQFCEGHFNEYLEEKFCGMQQHHG